LAVDQQRRRQMLVVVSNESEPIKHKSTRGLDVTTERLTVGDAAESTYIRLTCLLSAHHATFSALCSDILGTIASDPQEPRSAVLRCFDRWRSFWGADTDGLTQEEALGLFGELWFLYRWLAPLTFPRVQRWQGPSGSRHDFQWPEASVEVKTAAAGSSVSPVHYISNLDQLADPETGRLYLFSLHVADDALAANSLPSLVQQVTEIVRADEAASLLIAERLERVRYNPAHADKYSRKFRIVAEELYRIDDTFPRLTRLSFAPSLPSGVEDVSYCLSMSACAHWRIASSPSDSGAGFLRI